jgi:crotonobetainyl-CoA:carnitine CoA-transferase CaiB-like acyl-CoA transferase
MVEDVAHATLGPVRVLGTPLKLSDTPATVRMAPPTLGQHTAAILADDLRLSPAEIDALQAKRVV